MYKRITLLLVSLLTSILFVEAQNLKPYKWQKRIVLVNTEDEKLWTAQREVFKSNSRDIEERKLILMRTYKNKKFPLKGFRLIGLDGSVKLSSQEPFDLDTLKRTIDAMPMRKIELKKVLKLR